MTRTPIHFTPQTIAQVFGSLDAEREPIERLKAMFIKNQTYNEVTADLPLRVILGHKGTGKSAIIQMARYEEREKENLQILIKPDDIQNLGCDNDFLTRIAQWKNGLTKIIAEKVFEELEIFNDNSLDEFTRKGAKLLNLLASSLKKVSETIDLDPIKKRYIEKYLKNHKIVVFIDDLDRGWESRSDDIKRISALLNAVRDLSTDNQGLYFKIALRLDVFFLVRTSDESTDKILSDIVWLKWSNPEIFAMLIKRIKTFYNESCVDSHLLKTEQHYLYHELEPIIEKTFFGRGKWANTPIYKVMMSMVRKRPRDLIILCTEAAKKAADAGSSIIKTEHLQAVLELYSQERLQDTVNEYKSELPAIETLLMAMKPNQEQRKSGKLFNYTTNELNSKLRNIISVNTGKLKFANGRAIDPQSLTFFLYKINFITAVKINKYGVKERHYFDENRYLSHPDVNFGNDWEVHPSFRFTLQPHNLWDTFNNIDPFI